MMNDSITPMNDEEIKARIIQKLLRRHSTGPSATPIDEVSAWFPTHLKDDVQESLEELLRDPASPVEDAPGIAVTNVRLGSVEGAIEYLQSRDREVPWAFPHKKFEGNDEGTTTPSADSESELHDRITDLEEELGRMDEAAEDWRSEARRRQRLSVLFGVAGFVLGIITSGVISYLI